jgi:hypothetical protein
MPASFPRQITYAREKYTKMFNNQFEFVLYKRFWFRGGLTPVAPGRQFSVTYLSVT